MPSRRRRSPSNDPAAARLAEGYPHVTVRLMAAVYQQVAVTWTRDPLDQGLANGCRVLRVLDPDPDAADTLTPGRRQAVLDSVQAVSQRTRFRMCAVFARKDAVFVEPDGAALPSAEPPSGGVNLYDVQHVRPVAADEH